MSTTPYMNLTLPTPTVTAGPDWATQEVTALGVIDAHDHSPGKGTPVPAAGLDIDANLDIQTNKLVNVGAVNLESQSATLSASNLQSIYSVTGDLYFNNSAGTPVQITQGSSIASASSPLVPSGVMWAYGGSSAPTGFLMCDGSAVSRTTYSSLFSAVGTTYGTGDGSTTFNLPDMRGQAAIGAGTYTDSVSGSVTRTLGARLGAEKHVIVTAEMASHNHGGGVHSHLMFADVNSNPGTLSSASQFVNKAQSVAGAIADYILQGISTVATVGRTADSSTVITTQGSNTAHNNMQPSVVTNWIIKT